MILACNTESFLGITYDEATVVLKQATGNVRLLVISPTEEVEKRAEAKQAARENKIKAQADGKRNNVSNVLP